MKLEDHELSTIAVALNKSAGHERLEGYEDTANHQQALGEKIEIEDHDASFEEFIEDCGYHAMYEGSRMVGVLR